MELKWKGDRLDEDFVINWFSLFRTPIFVLRDVVKLAGIKTTVLPIIKLLFFCPLGCHGFLVCALPQIC